MSRKCILLSATALGATATAAFADLDSWHLLNEIDREEIVTDTSYEVRKSFPEALRNGAVEFEITGYAAPLTPGGQITELMLVSDTGSCPFCGSFEHAASLQVQLAEAIPEFDQNTRLSLRGTLEPVTDPEIWQAAILRNARIVAR